MYRPVRDGLSDMNGEVEKQKTEEEGGNEPSSPGDKKPERAKSEYKDHERTSECLIHILPSSVFCFPSGSFSGSDTKPKRQDIKSDPTPLGAIPKHTHWVYFHLSRLDR